MAPHRTAPELMRLASERGVPFDETTVYRSLACLQELDLVQCVAVTDSAGYYCRTEPPHHHAVCGQCQRLSSLPAQDMEAVLAKAAEIANFTVAPSGALTLHGQCAGCQAQAVSARTPGRRRSV